MKAHKIDGHCQRVGCEKSGTILYRIEGELFLADAGRGVEAGHRLYCGDCASGITDATDALK